MLTCISGKKRFRYLFFKLCWALSGYYLHKAELGVWTSESTGKIAAFSSVSFQLNCCINFLYNFWHLWHELLICLVWKLVRNNNSTEARVQNHCCLQHFLPWFPWRDWLLHFVLNLDLTEICKHSLYMEFCIRACCSLCCKISNPFYLHVSVKAAPLFWHGNPPCTSVMDETQHLPWFNVGTRRGLLELINRKGLFEDTLEWVLGRDVGVGWAEQLQDSLIMEIILQIW